MAGLSASTKVVVPSGGQHKNNGSGLDAFYFLSTAFKYVGKSILIITVVLFCSGP